MKTTLRKMHLSCIILLLTIGNLYSQTAGTRPNIIVILADDLGYADVGFNREAGFSEGYGIIPTPELDNLANNGIICTNAHVAHPFCGPSRAAIMTGVYPHRIGAQYNLPNNITTTLGVPDESYANESVFFPELIDDTGYNTAAYGKWHLGFTAGKFQPLDKGFDYFFGFLGGGKNYFESKYEDLFYNRQGGANPVTNEYQDPLQRNRSYIDRNQYSNHEEDDYLTDVLTDDVINYIDEKAADTDPFLIYLAYNAPHTPLQAPANEIAEFLSANPNFEDAIRADEYITQSRPVLKEAEADRPAKIEEFVQARITYATMVANMDKNIGRVVDKLEEKNELENTVIIFFSDNGGYTYSKGAVNYPLAALKGSVDEGGHKVPFFVHWPNKITSPGTYKYQISSLDLYPTLVNLAGGTIPTSKTIDGVDFMDKIIANEDARPNEALFVLRPQNGFHNAAIISHPYRIVRKGGNGAWKLYHADVNPEVQITGSIDGKPVSQIIAELEQQGANWARTFKDIKPAWFDHERGNGHPHRILWYGEDNAGNKADPVFPGYDSTYHDSSLGFEDVIKDLYRIYPNPSRENFNIQFNSNFNKLEIELLTTTGKLIKKINPNLVETKIQAQNLKAGMYLLKIKSDNNLSIEKVIKL